MSFAGMSIGALTLSLQHGMPVLAYESDGYAVSPAFLRQVDVHIQQVLECAVRRGGGGNRRRAENAAQ
jgi:hypothetical protein